MKVALISEYNHICSAGGTEYYVSMLAESLSLNNLEIILISKGNDNELVVHKNYINKNKFYKIYLLPNLEFFQSEIKQRHVSRSIDFITPILLDFRPDLIHFHTLSTFFNFRHIEVLHQNFRNFIFTSHIAGHLCSTGGLIRNKNQLCSGLNGMQCYLCFFHYDFVKGVKNLFKNYVSKIRNTINKIIEYNIVIVCVSEFQRNQFISNGIFSNKIYVIRQALSFFNDKQDFVPKSNKGVLRIGYLGRFTQEKGSRLLLKLIEKLNNNTKYHFVLGIPENSSFSEIDYLKQISSNSNNLKIYNNIDTHNKNKFFSNIDVLFIPSFIIETGPIVLLESIFYGKKVLAPNIGGPFEFLSDFKNMLLLYEWNNINSVIDSLNYLLTSEDYNSTNFMYREKIITQKNDFVFNHINIYNSLISDIIL